MNKKLTTRQLQALETKNKIIDCAMSLLSDVDFEKLKIASICKEANISIGTFYYHFKSLDFIIVESYKKVDNHFKALDEKNYFPNDPIKKIISIIEEQLKYTENKGVFIMSKFYKSQITVGTSFFISLERYLPKLIMGSVKIAKEQGVINNSIETEELTSDLLTISRGLIYDWCLKQGSFDLVKKGNKIIQNYLSIYIDMNL